MASALALTEESPVTMTSTKSYRGGVPLVVPAHEEAAVGEARRATASDAAELIRLRGVMLAGITGDDPVNDGWQHASARILEASLDTPDPTLVAFVIDAPGRPGVLAACAIGAVQQRLGAPGNPTGRTGYVFNVATDPAHRRNGHSRSCLTALLGWFHDRGITTIDLRTTPEGEPLYRSLGFVPAPEAMRLRSPSAYAHPQSQAETGAPEVSRPEISSPVDSRPETSRTETSSPDDSPTETMRP